MTVTQNRFRSTLLLAKEKLLAGEYGPTLNALVAQVRQMAADSDEVAELLEGDDFLALDFDGVVAAWKELRDERIPPRVRCRECPGAMHTADRCPFRWGVAS